MKLQSNQRKSGVTVTERNTFQEVLAKHAQDQRKKRIIKSKSK